ncbi:MAG TPA: hypothetical protein VFB50_15870 [Chloroflexota bacterium]|nr:hypothetical protein [Chloroflexota bacterium]
MSGIRGVAGLKTAIATVMSAQADVMRKFTVPDDAGGQIDTYLKVATLACSYRPATLIPRERESGFQAFIQSFQYWTFLFPAGSDILPTDRLIAAGRSYEVSGGGTPSIGIYAQFTCVEIL